MADTIAPPVAAATPAELRRRHARRQRTIRALASVAVLMALAGLWQALSYLIPAQQTVGGKESTPLVPGWDWIFTKAFPAIANYGGSGFGLSESEGGTAGTYHGAIVTLANNSADTWARLLVGLAGGAVIGTALAVGISWSRLARMFLALPAHVLRTVPLLAMIPLFQLWFGISFIGIFLFIAYGIGVIFFAGALNAIGNVPRIYIDNARTLGASSIQIYRTVVLPAIFPELRTAIILGLGVAWGAVTGAEFLGAQTGLGFIEVQARQFALLDRMVVVALFFLIYAALSYLAFELLSRPLMRWMPRAARL